MRISSMLSLGSAGPLFGPERMTAGGGPICAMMYCSHDVPLVGGYSALRNSGRMVKAKRSPSQPYRGKEGLGFGVMGSATIGWSARMANVGAEPPPAGSPHPGSN